MAKRTNGKSVDEQAEILKERFQRIGDAIDTELMKSLETCAILVENDAVLLEDAVDTGLLRKSITHAVYKLHSGAKAIIGTNSEYAVYVEFGTGIYADGGHGRKTPWVYKGRDGKFHVTKGMKPKHFMTNALNQNRKNIQQIMGDKLRGVVNTGASE